MLVQAEGLGRGQIPPELIFLAHDQGEAAAVGVFAPPRNVSQHAGGPGSGIYHAGEQFQRGCFAGSVWAQKGDELALLDRKIDAFHRLDKAIFPAEEPGNGGSQAFFFLINTVGLRQCFYFNCGHYSIIIDAYRIGGKKVINTEC